ncbi:MULTISPECIES: 1-acyl-sn-glycerol-3-phosphate acyltransferase [unclassified Sinorhizobium]|uniref:1-acyl-sn-glycerol-3-phosphate acyltransferase n=1 Tax=unclassified Sinorhizobium TaxID=2613772 RepID=UPI003524D96C
MTASLLSYASDEDRFFKRMAIRGIESALGRRAVEEVYERWRVDIHGVSQHPFGRMLEMYGIDFRIKGEWPVREIPDGPIVMVANHPFGVADGMALGAIAEHFGRPYRVIVNERMMKVPEFRPYILPISFDETAEAMEVNLSTRNEAIKLLRDGVTVGIFPSGGVATAPRGFGPAEELPWKMFLAKLIQMGRANVLPIFIEGQNSVLFQMVSRISPDGAHGTAVQRIPPPVAAIHHRSRRLPDALERACCHPRSQGRAGSYPAKGHRHAALRPAAPVTGSAAGPAAALALA